MSAATEEAFEPFAARMREAGLPELAIRTFAQYYAALRAGDTGALADADLEPVDVPAADDARSEDAGRAALAQTAVLKLNGGLGTSMGMTQAKSLLPVRGDLSFLDVIARQMGRLRERHGVAVPLVLMNSFRTRDDSLRALDPYGDLSAGLPRDFVQHKVPRIRADDLTPVRWPVQPEHEWCPPGHGDLYPALVTSGMLDALRGRGVRYAFVSNADNLGATLDLGILGWFAESGAPFAMEVKARTESDRKGGHLARLRGGGLVLREIAQCPDADRASFEDIGRWRYFNTNNLWLDLDALAAALDDAGGVLPLPMIRNEKTVDPKDAGSPRVVQLETAMGAAISVFAGAQALRVDARRFAPVKSTGDLVVVRSDAYQLDEESRVVPAPGREAGRLVVDLDGEFFKRVDQLEERMPHGPPSLVASDGLTVRGDVHFGRNVVVRGRAQVEAPAGQRLDLPDDTVLEG